MSYKILSHTADFAVEFSGKNLEDFFNTIVKFFSKEVIENYLPLKDGTVTQKLTYIDENLSYIVISFLNDLIFFIEKNIIVTKANLISYCKEEGRWEFEVCKVNCKALNLKIDLKAATYHNLQLLDITKYPIKLSVIFDL